jgi:phosphate transport system substrate-binding protein
MRWHNHVLALTAALVLLRAPPGLTDNIADPTARPYILLGSTTFTHRVIEPHGAEIEASCGHKLTVVPSKSSRGLLGLFKKQGDFAMISGPLETEIASLKPEYPDLSFERLQTFNIATTRMAFAVHPNNPIRRIGDDDMRRILLGKIVNWRDVGGQDLSIRIVMVRDGGGVQASIESDLLGGQKISVPDPILVQDSAQVVKIVDLMPEALGLSQLGIVTGAHMPELKTERTIEQRLELVTLGPPTSEMRKVINATREIMSKASER